MIDVGKTGEASEKRDYVRSLIAYLIIYKTLQHLNNIISPQQYNNCNNTIRKTSISGLPNTNPS
jgi:hypothetical protein